MNRVLHLLTSNYKLVTINYAMDNSLFAKYKQVVEKRDEDKGKIIDFVKEKTGVILLESEIVIDNKKITLNISSVKKSILFKSKIGELLKELGFFL